MANRGRFMKRRALSHQLVTRRRLALNHFQVGEGSQRSGSQTTNADQPRPSRNPPAASLGQWTPAQTRAQQARKITIAAATQRIHRRRGLTCGASENATMKLSQVKKTACPLG